MDEEGISKVIAVKTKDLTIQIKDLINTLISDLQCSNKSIALQRCQRLKG